MNPLPIAVYTLAALCEIMGCFAMWAWMRLGRSPLWLVPGAVGLMLFAYLLTRVDTAFSGRAYAAYGGIYVAMSLGWLWAAEGVRPDRWDLAGGLLCVAGCGIILWGPRGA